jgi:hypothetical protein
VNKDGQVLSIPLAIILVVQYLFPVITVSLGNTAICLMLRYVRH